MKTVRVAIDILGDRITPPLDHHYIHCHMVFDVKMEDHSSKARLVAEGHETKAPITPIILLRQCWRTDLLAERNLLCKVMRNDDQVDHHQ